MNTLINQENFSTKLVTFATKNLMPSEDAKQVLKQQDSKNMETKNFRILVVEDEPISQRVAQLALENMGYQVDIAGIGSKALELYQANNYDAILMDMGLPDTTGIEVTKKIRELEQTKGSHVPIIALTAHIAAMAKNECLEAGMDDFTSKPFEIEQLALLLKGWIGKTNS